MSLIKLSFNLSVHKAPVQLEPCKPILITQIIKEPQIYHYYENTGEVRMVRVNKNDGGK